MDVSILMRWSHALACLAALSLKSLAATDVSGDIPTSGWTEAAGPYHVTANARVRAGETLTISAGVVVSLEPGVSLQVEGTLSVNGTAEKGVVFRAQSATTRWGGVVLKGAAASAAIHYLELTRASKASFGGTDYPAAFDIVGKAKARIESSWIHDLTQPGIDSTGGSQLEILDSMVEECHEGIHSVDSYALIERVHIRNIHGYSDCIDFDNDSNPRSIIRDCILEHGEDDAIDFLSSTALVENITIHDISCKGLSIEGPGTPTFDGIVIYNCTDGVVSKDSASPVLRHVTVAKCKAGITFYEKNAGLGGGHGTADSFIVWDNETEVLMDALSSIALTFSDVRGGYAGAGNGDFAPLFMDESANDYRLKASSPAATAGKDGEFMGALPPVPSAGGTFVRGDANADGNLDISDAVTVLLYLFAGSGAPPCLDACDADDAGGINLTDAVYLLDYLFRAGGKPPAAPYPEPGVDPTGDDPYECAD